MHIPMRQLACLRVLISAITADKEVDAREVPDDCRLINTAFTFLRAHEEKVIGSRLT
jgi:hypothetical protein